MTEAALERRADPHLQPAASAAAARVGIVDIGSNSIRLVVYEAAARAPAVLFNEKVMAGLGRGVAERGRIADDSAETALAALARFARLAEVMEVRHLRVVGTAALREAANAEAFLARVRARTGLAVEVLGGEAEARASALGVLAGIPGADGVVGDLGGGSLELVRVAEGTVHARASLPLGVLRLVEARRAGRRALARLVEEGLATVDWDALGRGRTFYMVGGSWRALAQLHMHVVGWPLPVIHQHLMTPDVPARLVRILAGLPVRRLREIPNLSAARIPHLPAAASLLRVVTERLEVRAIVASAWGLREGLLFADLPPETRAQDPLLAAARSEAVRTGDPGAVETAEALTAWTDPLFPGDGSRRRLREAAALLAQAARRAHPDMRAERGLDIALHGNWAGIDAAERAVLAATLWALHGGAADSPALDIPRALAPATALARARAWGLALRLGQRLGGGTAAGLVGTAIGQEGEALVLSLGPARVELFGEAVARRHRLLADQLGLRPELRLNRWPAPS